MKRVGLILAVCVSLGAASFAVLAEEDSVLYGKGSQGEEIKAVQEKLVDLGYLSGSQDGVFGDKTEEALKSFQEDNGLEVSGSITEKTMEVLNNQKETGSVATYDLAFVNSGRFDSTYYLFDTENGNVVYFDTADDLVMKTDFTGNLADGVELDWSEYGDGWHDSFTYEEGSDSAEITDENGNETKAESCDAETAQQILESKSGYDADESRKEELPSDNEAVSDEQEGTEIADGSEAVSAEGVSDWLQYYEEKGIEVRPVDADILYQYAEYYAGSTVYTAFEVSSVATSTLRADTESNSSLFHYSVVCDFDDSSEIEDIEKDDTVAVIGTSSGDSYATLSDCHLIAAGSEAKEIKNELAENTNSQIDFAMSRKDVKEADQAEADAAEKQAYIVGCESVDYNDVARNPDSYDGKKIQVSGSVIQVSEGWFNSVTLRVEQSDGNIWYVSYSRNDNESRVLEGDYVTIYGECDGVTSYTSILGEKITIPSLDAEYID